MSNYIVKFETPTGEMRKIRDRYLSSRNIFNRYTRNELKRWSKVDLYFLLDLDMYREEQIPLYILNHVVRIKMREYHPNFRKNPPEAFILVGIANNIFRDRKLRLLYDSSFFDESIPEDRFYDRDEFFSVFGECFDRNAKFSMNRPVPRLNPAEEGEDVEKFYEFWRHFKSWRAFEPVEEFYRMDEYERSLYSNRNKKRLLQLKNEDVLRIRRLVQIAKKRDPRLEKSIEWQTATISLEKSWTTTEMSMLMKLMKLSKSVKKKRWEAITNKLIEITKIERSMNEVMKKGIEMCDSGEIKQ